MKEAYKLFHEGVLHFTEMQYDGICINTQLLESSLSEAKTKFAHLEKEVQGLEWLQNVDYTSNIKLAMAIIRAFRINLPTTEKGNYRVDKHTLSKLKKVKGIDSLLALGKHKKIIILLCKSIFYIF